jgi:hypothetical protein
VAGPFPANLISDYLLLGRLRTTDEVSQDGQTWQPLARVSRLIPDTLRRVKTDEDRWRLEVARRRVDERMNDRRSGKIVPPEIIEKRRRERRRLESPQMLAQRAGRVRHREGLHQQLKRPAYWVPALFVILLASAMLVSYYHHGSDYVIESSRDCQRAPAPGVNWNHCSFEKARLASADLTGAILNNARLHGADLRRARLPEADLNYVELNEARLDQGNLRQASLRGAVLRDANLEGADLTGADLRNADLRGANMRGARLDQAKLGRAIWTDGRQCDAASVGACRSPSLARP